MRAFHTFPPLAILLCAIPFAWTVCQSYPAASQSTLVETHIAVKPGYTNTPYLPDMPWHVHDPNRPGPHVVTPGNPFSIGAKPPSDAIVLFDGKELSEWTTTNGAPRWKVENGYMEVVPRSGDIFTKVEFGDFQLHLEFATPVEVRGDSQDRGNSGLKIYGRYEVQILDSYENATYPDGQCAALYGQYPPLVNACAKPGAWQSYDIIFESPLWDENHKLIKPACVTVIQNGVVVQNHKSFLGTTKHRLLPEYTEHPPHGPILLQEHRNPVRFKNIWIRDLDDHDAQ